MTRAAKIVWFLCLAIFLGWLTHRAFGQTFQRSLPFLAKSTSITYDPNSIAPLTYWWVASDISSNDPVLIWYDRTNNFPIVQTNVYARVTNSVHGLCFDGHGGMITTNALNFHPGGTVFVILHAFPQGHCMNLIENSLMLSGLRITSTNGAEFRLNNALSQYSAPLNPTNLLTIGYVYQAIVGSVAAMVTYTNGTLVASNNLDFSPGAPVTWKMDSFGYGGYQVAQSVGRLDQGFNGYFKEILVWTNAVLTAANFTYLEAYAQWKYGSDAPDVFFNPDSIPNLSRWVRMDGGYLSTGGGGEMPTNLQYISEFNDLKNPDNSSRYWQNQRGFLGGPRWHSSGGANNRPWLNIPENTDGTWRGYQAQLAFEGSQPNYFFGVLRQTNNATTQFTFLNTAESLFDYANSAAFAQFGSSYKYYSSPRLTNGWTVLSGCFDGTNSWMRTNGVALGTTNSVATVGTNKVTADVILGYAPDGGMIYKGYFSEYLHYTNSMNTNDIQAVEQYLGNKYAITITP